MTWGVAYGFIYQGTFFLRYENGHCLGDTPMMDLNYAQKQAKKFASKYTLGEVHSFLQTIIETKPTVLLKHYQPDYEWTDKDTIIKDTNRGHNSKIYNHPMFCIDKDPLSDCNKKAVKKIIKLTSGATKQVLQKRPESVRINTFEDVFAHSYVFQVPEGKHVSYLTSDLKDTYDNIMLSNCATCAVINLDKPVLCRTYNKGETNEQLIECFDLEYNVAKPITVFDENKDCFPNMMSNGHVTYDIRFKHNENQSKYPYSVPH